MSRGGSGSRTPEAEGGTMPEAPQWARVRGDRNFGTRRGAWHELLRLTPEEAIIAVGQRSVSIPRASVQIGPVRPHSWAVVPRPTHPGNRPLTWGPNYPHC